MVASVGFAYTSPQCRAWFEIFINWAIFAIVAYNSSMVEDRRAPPICAIKLDSITIVILSAFNFIVASCSGASNSPQFTRAHGMDMLDNVDDSSMHAHSLSCLERTPFAHSLIVSMIGWLL